MTVSQHEAPGIIARPFAFWKEAYRRHLAGCRGGGTGTPYYDIELMLRDGRKLTLGRTLKSKQEAEWLVDEMRRLVSVQAKSATAGMV